MDDMTYLQLRTNMEIIQEIRSFRLEHAINEHVSCHLTGIINEKDKDNYVKEINEERVIEIFVEGPNPHSLFRGLIEEIEVKFIGGMYEVEIKGISTSFLTDLDKKSRSFQDKNMTYKTLVETIMKNYLGGDIIDYASQGVAIENLIV